MSHECNPQRELASVDAERAGSPTVPPATILLASFAGYAAMTEAHSDLRAAEIAGSCLDEVSELLPRYRGAEIRTTEPVLLARFEEAPDALSAAARIVGDVGARYLGLGVRAGLHTSEQADPGADWLEVTVDVARRVGDFAKRGEVLFTSETRQCLQAAAAGGRLAPRGSQEFGNATAPIGLYALEFGLGRGKTAAVDPVCRMRLDPACVKNVREVGVRRLWFCSATCAQSFDAHPQWYDIEGRQHQARSYD